MLTGLAGEFDEDLSERGIKDEFQVFSLNNWLNDSVIYWANGRTNFGEVNSQEFYLDNIKLELDDIPWWAQMTKNLPAMQETQIGSLGWEDPLEKGMATHSSILAWKIPWT